jgi:hypothetical protein
MDRLVLTDEGNGSMEIQQLSGALPSCCCTLDFPYLKWYSEQDHACHGSRMIYPR